MRIVLATTNKGKCAEFVREMSKISAFKQVFTLADFPKLGNIEENGTTFQENSLLKAQAVCDFTGLTAVADDSGLCVEALDGQPGIFSARYSGENATDEKNLQKVLQKMTGKTNRKCKFVCAIACVFPDERKIQVIAEWNGVLTNKPIGENGFGYDPIFLVSAYGKTFSQMTGEEKNAVSHRGRAAKKISELINTAMRIKEN